MGESVNGRSWEKREKRGEARKREREAPPPFGGARLLGGSRGELFLQWPHMPRFRGALSDEAVRRRERASRQRPVYPSSVTNSTSKPSPPRWTRTTVPMSLLPQALIRHVFG